MLKWIINKWYKNNPKCFCGYRMKSIKNKNKYETAYRWKCIFIKRCGWEAFESSNSKLHWYRK